MTAQRFQNGPRTRKGPHREMPDWIGRLYLAACAAFFLFILFR